MEGKVSKSAIKALLAAYMLVLFLEAQASDVVTRRGFIEKVDLSHRVVVVDGTEYEFGPNLSVFIGRKKAKPEDLQKGMFVTLTVKRGTLKVIFIEVITQKLRE